MSASKTTGTVQLEQDFSMDTCKVMVLYENLLARQKAAETCNHMMERLADGPAFELDWWPFHCLTTPALAQFAEEAAAEADIIVFSLHGEEFPKEIVNWLENWPARRTNASGLLVLLATWAANCPSVMDTPAIQLENVAHRHGMDFLAETHPEAAAMLVGALTTDTEAERAAKAA